MPGGLPSGRRQAATAAVSERDPRPAAYPVPKPPRAGTAEGNIAVVLRVINEIGPGGHSCITGAQRDA
jgi:hypothetical protein